MSATQTESNRFWDWQSAALVVVLVQLATSRLKVTEWVPFLEVPQTLGFWAVLLGLALGYSLFSPRSVRWLGFIYGLILIPAQLLNAIEHKQTLNEDLLNIALRLADAFNLLIKNQPIYDALFFITLASLGFWGIGLYAGYQLLRHRTFLNVVLPAGLIMLVVQVYDPATTLRLWALAAYLFVALALLGRLHFIENKDEWRDKRIFFSSDTEWDLSRSALTLAAAAVFIAWILPNALSSMSSAASAWDEFTEPARERFLNATSALDSPYNSTTGGDFYSSSLQLGKKTPTSDTPVFYVKDFSTQSNPARYYWRGRTYDQYRDGRWLSPASEYFPFSPSSNPLTPGDISTRHEARFTVTLNFPKQELLYAPAELMWTDQSSRMLLVAHTDETVKDISGWQADSALTAGEEYTIRALVANPSVVELRAAGSEYPQWVKERYLQIPEDINPQIKGLAESITQDVNTPYDKTIAVTNFLRKEIRYTTELIENPPGNTDPVLWMLLEYKQGFCMYSASAEVLLLRALGIPARMAVGFAQGEFDAGRGRYVVTLRDSHAWPEVYFPQIGWVEFEPTGNQAPLARMEKPIAEETAAEIERLHNSENVDLTPGTPDKGIEDVELGGNGNQAPPGYLTQRYLYPALLTGLLGLVIFVMKRYSIVDHLPVYLEGRYIARGRQPPDWLGRWSTWATLTPIQRAFHAIDLSLRWLGDAQPAHITPLERANRLVELLPSATAAIIELKQEHESALFTNHPENIERARRAGWKVIMEALRTKI